MTGSEDASYWREASEDARVVSRPMNGPGLEKLRVQLSQMRATKIQMESAHDSRLAALEAEIDRVETAIVTAEEADWAAMRGARR